MFLRPLLFVTGSCLALACSSNSSANDAGHPTEASSKDSGNDVHTTKSEDAGVDAPVANHDSGKDARSDVVDSGPPPYDGPVYTLEAGVTWSALYRDYFSNKETASCSGQNFCHAAPSDHGAEVSSFVCPGGDASAACYAGMLNQDAGFPLVTPDASFPNDLLSQVLCNADGGGTMPYDCSYTFTKVDLERIQAWVVAGAQNN